MDIHVCSLTIASCHDSRHAASVTASLVGKPRTGQLTTLQGQPGGHVRGQFIHGPIPVHRAPGGERESGADMMLAAHEQLEVCVMGADLCV